MKADPKAKTIPKAEAKEAAAAPKTSKKKLMIVIVIALVAVMAGAGAAWFFLQKGGGEHKEVKKVEAPVFVAIEPFTVNLLPETGEQYLQIALTLQVAGLAQVDVVKTNMPKVRSRLLMLLSSKKASEISTLDGKKKLTDEIIKQIKQPFSPEGSAQDITGVFFTSFIIQ